MTARECVILAACFALPFSRAVDAQDESALKLNDVLEAARVEPVTFPESSISTADFLVLREAWAKRRFLPLVMAELRERVENDPESARTVEELVGWWGRSGHDFGTPGRGAFEGRWWTWRADSANESAKPLAQRAKALIPRDAAKPVAQFLLGSLLHATRDWEESKARLRVGARAAEAGARDPLITALLAVEVASENWRGGSETIDPAKVLQVLPLALSSKAGAAQDAEFIVDAFISRSHLYMVARRSPALTDAFMQSELPEWARLTLAGHCVAKGVAELQAADPRARKAMQAASDCFQRAWKAHPQRPEAAAGMIKLAFGGFAAEGESPRVWFNRATAAQCDFRGAYEQMLSTLHPRNAEASAPLVAFGWSCAQTTRVDTDVPEYFLIALGSLSGVLPDWRMPFRQPEIASAVKRLLANRVAAAPTPQLKKHYQGMCIAWGYMTGNFELAAENLLALQQEAGSQFFWPHATGDLLSDFVVDLGRMIEESLALGDQSTAEIRAMQEAWEKGDYEKAENLARAELARTPPVPHRNWIVTVGMSSQFSARFAKGGWTNLSQAPGCWYRWNTGTEHPGGNALSFATRLNFSQGRQFRPALGKNYELRGQVKLPEGASSLTLRVGTPDEFNALRTWRCAEFQLSTKDRKASQVRTRLSWENGVAKEGPTIGPLMTFRLQRKNDRVSWWIDEKIFVEDHPIPGDLPGGASAFGFVVNTFGGKAPVTLENLQARKL